MAAGRKQVAFDLDTEALKIYYPTESWRSAYKVIKRHMQKNGFLWQQGSVYVSEKPMLSREVSAILDNLVAQNPWLNVCMRDCRQANIGKEHSQNYIFDADAKIPTQENKSKFCVTPTAPTCPKSRVRVVFFRQRTRRKNLHPQAP